MRRWSVAEPLVVDPSAAGSENVHAVPWTTRIDEMFQVAIPTGIVVFFAWQALTSPSPDKAAIAILLCVASLPAGLSILALSKVLRRGRTVTVSEGGLCAGGGRLIEWQEIASVRERGIAQRADLLGSEGSRLAVIDYAIRDAEQVLVLVQKRRSPDLAALPASFGGRRPPLSYVLVNVVAFIGFIALGWAAFPSVFWVGLLMSAIFAVAVYYEMRDIVFETELAGSGLILRTFFGERTIERSRIVKVALHLRRTRSYGSAWSGFRSLNVGVALNTGETVWTKPRRGNAFDLHRAIVRWLEV